MLFEIAPGDDIEGRQFRRWRGAAHDGPHVVAGRCQRPAPTPRATLPHPAFA